MKRRDFIRTVAASGSAAMIVGSSTMASEPQSLSGVIRNKTLFISDIHLNVDAEYSWTSPPYLAQLTEFLGEVNQRPDVAELVILGDLVDNWVVPVADAPNSFADILSRPVNQGVVSALQAICKNSAIKVTYLTGNHDLLSWQQANKAVLQQYFPEMLIISEYPGYGSWSKNQVVWAEHGHRYCLFNAADVWSHKPSQLPLGYFMSRLAATASVNQHQKLNTVDLIAELASKSQGQLLEYLSNGGWTQVMPHSLMAKGIHDDAMISLIYYAEAAWSNCKPHDKYAMSGMDGFKTDPTVWNIGKVYDKILSRWPVRQGRVPGVIAFFDDCGALSNAADILFAMPAWLQDDYPFKPRIILFGHTHKALIQNNTVDGTIYINTGAWVDGKPTSYAEIETTISAVGTTYTATLFDYGQKSVIGQGSITV
jgi:UDP-2,3-diacylglucosamine pyrophosphatase LpxH